MRISAFILPVLLLARLGHAAAPLAPAVEQALHALTADDFPTRQKAITDLQIALGEQMRAFLTVTDPEAQSRLADLIEFEGGICRWAGECYKLPPDQRRAAVDFATRPDILPIIGKLYAPRAGTRLEAVKALSKITDPAAAGLLARMIDDPDRAVCLAAMEAAWDRQPTAVLVQALWYRAVEAGLAANRARPITQRTLTFRGVAIGTDTIADADNSFPHVQDNNIACDVLIHLQPPLVTARLKAFLMTLQQTVAQAGAPNPPQAIYMYMPTQEPMRNVIRLIEATKPRGLVPILYQITQGPPVQRAQSQINNQRYFWSGRTWAIAELLKLTDRDPAELKLTRLTEISNVWAIPTEADENAAIASLKTWWAQNGGQYEAPSATAPLSTPDAKR